MEVGLDELATPFRPCDGDSAAVLGWKEENLSAFKLRDVTCRNIIVSRIEVSQYEAVKGKRTALEL